MSDQQNGTYAKKSKKKTKKENVAEDSNKRPISKPESEIASLSKQLISASEFSSSCQKKQHEDTKSAELGNSKIATTYVSNKSTEKTPTVDPSSQTNQQFVSTSDVEIGGKSTLSSI